MLDVEAIREVLPSVKRISRDILQLGCHVELSNNASL